MKIFFAIIALIFSSLSFSQEDDKKDLKAQKKATNYVFEANKLVSEDFVSAEMEYRKAISESKKAVAAPYNLAHSYYKEGKLEESLIRHQQAARLASTKEEKHRAYHNIGNILMQNELCKEAVEAFKNALRNNPSDDESRYNLAMAKECAKNQDGGGEDEDKKKDEQEQNKEDEQKKDDQGDEKKENKDQGEDDKKEGEEKEDENGKPKDEKQKQENEKGKGDKEKKQQKPKPQPGKLSKQQIKNLLQAMNDKEQKVQEKINAKKQKGAKVKTDKDW
ncbi:tetratricopeptide repeat protein [Ichthyenterobacterium sp. W332]|uniref:Tetratricopeptide repeat protein n=1 Tax=Microcosmobacter mediterraneus TaxID=3075607 RepID=A0ABU2YJ55_9FLAO|nr:tetratricopeptide repeat protein [Ichthyenterobacterium sp. W332]MDT0558204.1 tetratricopeptide repeat protein [Ichthyenterobacterium sp. W332]